MSLSVYPEYKPSNLSWIDKVPCHWQIKRLRFLIRTNPIKSELTGLKEDDLVSFVPMDAVGEYGGLRLSNEKELGDVYAGYTYFRNDDVLVAKITPCFENGKGAIAAGLRNATGFGTTELHVLRAVEGITREYLFYLSVSYPFREIGASQMLGAGGQKRISEEFIKDFRFAVPNVKEQQKIVEFLEHKTFQIDALIEKKRALIEKLNEKRTAVITQAVTKGLDPSVPMKDSGVEWMGEVPEHWVVKQLKQAVTFQRGHDLTSDERKVGNVPVITSGGFTDTHAFAKARGPGIVTGRYGTIGRFYYVAEDYWPHNTTLYSINLRGNDARYLWYLVQHLTPLFILNSQKSAVPGVDRNDLHPVSVAIPTSVDEQREIINHLEAIIRKLDKIRAQTISSIALLQERRTALITAAVTGRIDVRAFGVAAAVLS